MSIIQFQVTQADIDAGEAANTTGCAIALAMKRHLTTLDVSVSATHVLLYGKRYKTTDSMASFIHDFDRSKALVFPTEFLLDTSTPLSHTDYTSIFNKEPVYV